MDIRDFKEFVRGALERMRADGYGKATIGNAEWVLTWFLGVIDQLYEVKDF